jgi:hypothetical protein
VKLLALACLIGCGRIDFLLHVDGADGTDGSDASIRITAPATALPATETRLAADREVTWSTDLGSFAAGGVFRAGETDGTATITATSIADPRAVTTATIEVTRAISPREVAAVPAVIWPAGLATQVHGFYSDRTKAWWFFYTDEAPSQLVHSLTSMDFASWTAGPTLDAGVPIGNDGRNFSLARRVIADHEIIHLAQSYETGRGRIHVRAELDAAGLVFGGVTRTSLGGTVSPDGPAVVITEAGEVIDASGYDQTPPTPPLSPCTDGDAELYTAEQAETGTTSFDLMSYSKQVLWCPNSQINSRFLASDGDTVYYLYEDGAVEPQPVNVLYNIRRAGVWSPDETVKTTPPAVFTSDDSFALEDWTALVHDRTLLVMRRLANGTTEVRYLDLDTSTAFTGSTQLLTADTKRGSGIVMQPYGAGVIALELVADTSGTNFSPLEYAFWNGLAWSGWHPLIGPEATRDSISGVAGGAGGRPAVVWAEGGGIMGVALP